MIKLAKAIFIVSCVVFLSSLFLLVFLSKTIETQSLYASVNITDFGGFDVNSTALIFGNIIRGGSSTRNVVFTNGHKFPVVVESEAVGDISSLLTFDNSVKVDSGETKKVSFSALAEKNASDGFYSGYVILKVKRSF